MAQPETERAYRYFSSIFSYPKYYINKTYKCIPELDKNSIYDLEIYDTSNFYSFGDFENEMTVYFGTIEDNKINTKILINEEYVLIEFNDMVHIQEHNKSKDIKF